MQPAAPPHQPRPPLGQGFVLGRIAGIELAVHASWLITFTILVVLTRYQVVVHMAPAVSNLEAWLLAMGFGLAFFLSIVVHEFCHSIVARMYGLDARRITLFLFGGVSQIGREPPGPGAEYTIAIAGPLASLLLAGVFAAGSRLMHPFSDGLPGAAGFLAVVNLFLAGFNLVPGFPLDGGRILRSALWAGLRDRARATRLASYGGKAVAVVLIGLGAGLFVSSVWNRVGDGLTGLWWALLGWFLYGAVGSAARAEGGAPRAEAPEPSPPIGVRSAERADTLGTDEGPPPQPEAHRRGGGSAPGGRPPRAAADQPRDGSRHPRGRAAASRGATRRSR